MFKNQNTFYCNLYNYKIKPFWWSYVSVSLSRASALLDPFRPARMTDRGQGSRIKMHPVVNFSGIDIVWCCFRGPENMIAHSTSSSLRQHLKYNYWNNITIDISLGSSFVKKNTTHIPLNLSFIMKSANNSSFRVVNNYYNKA